MADLNAPYGRNQYGSPNRPNERVLIVVSGDAVMSAKWADHITSQAPVLDALPIPRVLLGVVNPTRDTPAEAAKVLSDFPAKDAHVDLAKRLRAKAAEFDQMLDEAERMQITVDCIGPTDRFRLGQLKIHSVRTL